MKGVLTKVGGKMTNFMEEQGRLTSVATILKVNLLMAKFRVKLFKCSKMAKNTREFIKMEADRAREFVIIRMEVCIRGGGNAVSDMEWEL